ncbi:MAG TPA: class III extradiol dioxygenase subunit B-like domain-containing protein [Micromonosporaceae bacterium]|nr:class III extradiol dioxygenase subunit B-like domain-containing protein [Micromonosporaceae bacterium]
MPIVAAAVCPHPPLLVPQVAAGAAAELDELREACDGAVARLAGSGARVLLIVGADTAETEYRQPFHGSLRRFGVPVDVGVARGPELPLSLTLAIWLVSRSFRPIHPVTYVVRGIPADAPPELCVRRGAGWRSAEPTALLVMGDGSACRGEKAPGYDDPRAAPYDASVAAALAAADTGALRALDPGLSTELHVAGRAPWQVLAGAVAAEDRPWRGDLCYDAAPYGVGYFVAVWEPQ